MQDRMKEMTIRLMEDERVFAVLMAFICALVLISVQITDSWYDVDNYYDQISQILAGHMPYSDVMFEYPPFAAIFMIIPALFTWDRESYHFAFAILVYIFLILGVYFLRKISDEYIGSRWQANLFVILLVGVCTHFIICRYDVFPAVMVVISLWFYFRKKYVPAFLIMSLAAMTKLYPVLFLVPMAMPFLVQKDWKRFITAIVVSGAACLLTELPFILNDPSTAFAWMSYHSDRGLQVEAFISSFILLGSLFVQSDITLVHNYGSYNLEGALPDMIAPYMNIVMVAAVGLFILAMLVKMWKSKDSVRDMDAQCAVFCLALVLIFILFSKVYSAQYVIWIVLLLPFTQLASLEENHRLEAMVLMVPFLIATFLAYSMMVYLIEMNPGAIVLQVIKNVMHLILTIAVMHFCWCEMTGKTHCLFYNKKA